MDLARFEITPALRHSLEPLLMDALFEYGVRHRARAGLNKEAAVQLTVAQAMEVLAAQQARWNDRLRPVLEPLKLTPDRLPRRIGGLLHELLLKMHEFFRREGAVTFRAAVAVPNDGQRFSLLWTDVFSRRVLDWLREHDLVSDPDHLDVPDTLVECAKLWAQELSRLIGPKAGPVAEPSAFFLDAESELTALFERGPVKLKVRGRPDGVWLRPVAGGLHLHACRSGEPDMAALRIVQTVFLMALLERARQQPVANAAVAFFRWSAAHGVDDFPNPVETAFAGFLGNEAVVRRLKLGMSLALRHSLPRPMDNYLLIGAAGLGKTELARRVAKGLGVPLIEVAAAAIKKNEDLLREIDHGLLPHDRKPVETGMESGKQVVKYPGMVLFLDEASEWRRLVEPLRPLLDVHQRRLFTETRIADLSTTTVLVGASSAVKIPEPFLASCRRLDLEPYRPEEVAVMLRPVFTSARLQLPDALAATLARMGRCNPRRALELARELRDKHERAPEKLPLSREALLRLARDEWHLDERGLAERDYQYLKALESGPKGLPALQQLLPFGGDEVTAVIEPYLVQLGVVHRSSRGRVLTVLGEQLLHRRVG